MFLHIIVIDRQISVHTKDKEPLKEAVEFALKFWMKTDTNLVTHTENRRVLDWSKTAEDNGLKENDLIIVSKKEVYDAETKRLEEAKKSQATTV